MKTLLVLIAMTIGFSLSADAQVRVIEAPDEVRYHKVQRIDFTKTEIKGRLVKPEFGHVRVKKKVNFRSMIELRSSFRSELSRSAEKL